MLIEISKKFKKIFIQVYKDNWFWSWIMVLLAKRKTSLSSSNLPFCFENNLIFCHDGYIFSDHIFESRCLCISQLLIKETLRVNHDENGHLRFLCYYKKIASSSYICNFSSQLKAYFNHYPFCNINQTCRHLT